VSLDDFRITDQVAIVTGGTTAPALDIPVPPLHARAEPVG
jgi:hypothetical protein